MSGSIWGIMVTTAVPAISEAGGLFGARAPAVAVRFGEIYGQMVLEI